MAEYRFAMDLHDHPADVEVKKKIMAEYRFAQTFPRWVGRHRMKNLDTATNLIYDQGFQCAEFTDTPPCHAEHTERTGRMNPNVPDNVMTPWHPLWEEFARQLEIAVGSCNQSPQKPQCRNILHALNHNIQAGKAAGPLIDVEASLRWFEEHGGNCDCDVLLFVVGP